MSTTCFFSIATGSHVALSVALFESALAHFDKAGCEPEQFLFFLGCDGSLPSTMMGDVHVVHVESIIDSVLIARLEDLYTPAEFCWVLKPFVFRWLLDQFDAVFYFDSDGWITGSFDEFVVELGDSPILLTPHYLEPFGCVSECGSYSQIWCMSIF
ncbi:hypothetical protein RIE95_09870 [Acidithiobacillus thiooxidans]|uniref:hypothetical protein n=1 Tax=Acidithiobacillus thiooxidans TaxID=930 RepID=UPI00285683AD|nr:hypothetical protein [Acidithiobacillus thiooxidans]MDR7927286.1 hypothetical protein [Acidithiobacillus thiooxidans]